MLEELKLSELFIWVHLVAAVLAIMLGLKNFVAAKGTYQHRLIG